MHSSWNSILDVKDTLCQIWRQLKNYIELYRYSVSEDQYHWLPVDGWLRTAEILALITIGKLCARFYKILTKTSLDSNKRCQTTKGAETYAMQDGQNTLRMDDRVQERLPRVHTFFYRQLHFRSQPGSCLAILENGLKTELTLPAKAC